MTSTSVAPTNLGPLTTTFTPAPSCNVVVERCPTCGLGWFGQGCDPTSHDDPNCWPPRTQGVATPTYALSGWGYYSPGVICPSGYVSACSATGGIASGFDFGFDLAEGETAVGCCPSGLPCHARQTCSQTVSSTTFPVVSCEDGTSGAFQYITLPIIADGTSSSSYILNGPMFQIVFKNSDLPVSTTQTQTSTTSTTSSSSLTSSTTSISTSTSTSTAAPTHKSSSNLASGAIAGVSVAAALILISLITLTILYLKRRQKSQSHIPLPPTSIHSHELYTNTQFGSPSYQERSELGGGGNWPANIVGKAELGNTERMH